MHRVDELVRLLDQACRLRLVDGAVFEGGVFEHFDHLPRNMVALGGDVLDARLKQRIGRVIPLQRGGRDARERQDAEISKRRVDCLVSCREVRKDVTVGAQRLTRRPIRQCFEQDAAVMRVIVC